MRTPDVAAHPGDQCCLLIGTAAKAEGPALGKPADAALIRMMDLTILPDGRDLPPGRGSATEGKQVYENKCLACHGIGGQGQPMDRLTGGLGSLATTARR